MVEAYAAASGERAAALKKAREAQTVSAEIVRKAEESLAPITAKEEAASAAGKSSAAADGGLRVLEESLGSGHLPRDMILEILLATIKESASENAFLEAVKKRAQEGTLPGVDKEFVPAFPSGDSANSLPPNDVARVLGVSGLDRAGLLLLLHAHAKAAGASAQVLDTLRRIGGVSEPVWKEDPTEFVLPESEEAKAAKEAVRVAKVEESNAAGEVGRLEKEEGMDFGPGGAFHALKGQCYDLRFQQYTYTVCPFGSAKQDSTNLGSFSGWGESSVGVKDYGVALFTGGSMCWNGPARSIKVTFQCGSETKLLAVE